MTPPITLALLICEHTWQDPNSGKYALLGTYSGIGAYSFPLAHRTMAVYFALTEGRGTQAIRVELVDIDEERPPVFEVEANAEFVDPRQVFEGAFQFTNINFPEPGEYRLKLFAGREFLMERKLEVALATGVNRLG